MNNSDMYVKMKNHGSELKLSKFVKYYDLLILCVCVCVCRIRFGLNLVL